MSDRAREFDDDDLADLLNGFDDGDDEFVDADEQPDDEDLSDFLNRMEP